jgi:CspA family cold shock protein
LVRSQNVLRGATGAIHESADPLRPFRSKKGFRFIRPDGGGRDVFVHISAVEKAGLTSLDEGQVIEYEEVSDRGRTSVGNLKVQR